jgi:hypothetical protein
VAAFEAAADRPAERVAPSRQTTAVWREQALAEISSSELTVKWLRSPDRAEHLDDAIADEIERHLDLARMAAVDTGLSPLQRLLSFLKGASIERTWGEIDAAGEALLRGAPSDFALGQVPRVRRRAERALKPTDSRRLGLQRIVDSQPDELSVTDREVLVTALHAANCEARRKQSRVRSFRNMLLLASLVLTIAAIGLGLLGLMHPRLALMCFQPSAQAVCPTAVVSTGETPVTGQPEVAQDPEAIATQDRKARDAARPADVLLVELVGLIAAALAAAAALRRIHGTSTPYGVPFAVAVLKLPSGMLTAALGLLLIRADFVPGLSALDTPAQIIGWAIVFGYAQQLFTRFVDARAQTVLDTATGSEPCCPRHHSHPGER